MMLRDEAAGWLRLGEVAPQLLGEMRLQLLWAAQLVAAVGMRRLAPRPDHSDMTMEWLAGHELLVGARSLRGRSVRVGLRVATFGLVVLDAMERPVDEIALEGRTLGDVRAWLEAAIAERAGNPEPPLELPDYELPDHPVAGGRTFELQAADACIELARWYAGADVVLRELASITSSASAVRCWPQRLDLRTRIMVMPYADGQPERAISVGMSPGDVYYPEPYWYTEITPAPVDAQLPALSHGAQWRANGWTGTVLRARKLLPGTAAGQRERLVAFLGESIEASRALLMSGAEPVS
jgi:hypothetical protein